jgi:hypothetical protein
MNSYDENEKCIKCGFDRIEDTFLPKGSYETIIAIGQGTHMVPRPEDVIHRTCLRCKYAWDVKPLL